MAINYDIKLYNRYGDNIGLKEYSNDGFTRQYTLEGELNYMRCIYDAADNKKLHAIDPSGGPYMAVDNFSIDNDSFVLSSIDEDEKSKQFILTFNSWVRPEQESPEPTKEDTTNKEDNNV